MKNLIKMELKKAIFSKFFLMGLAVLLLFSVMSGIYMVENRVDYNPEIITTDEYYFENGKFVMNPDLPLFGFYNSWVGGEALSLFQVIFYYLLPVGAIIPFAWSYHTERKNGYLKNIASRIDKKKYFIAKAMAVFTSGSLVVLISLIVNIAIVSAFVPAIEPFATYTFYNYIYIGDMWVDYYYSNPALYVALYVMLDTLYGGIFALLSFATAFYVKNIFAVMFLPFISVVAVGYIRDLSITYTTAEVFYEFNPITYLHSLMYGGQREWWVIWGIALILLLFSLCTIFIRGFRDEIF